MADLNAVQTAVTDLEIGMYIAALDRPWIDTPFLVQGFYITSQQDIEALEKHCKYVFVDVYRSKLQSVRRSSRIIGVAGEAKPIPYAVATDDGAGPVKFKPRSTPAGPLLFPHRKLKKFDDAATFEQELPQAKAACAELVRALAAMTEGFRKGGALDVSGVRAAIAPLVECVVRNPDACVWLAHVKTEANYGDRHSLATAIWAVALGRHLGLPKIDLQRMALGAALFDVGKHKVPPELLQKRERLTPQEFELL
jgi:HD-GYP domain-containing protein (c-di-GMP phosphodiesterase class II)